MKRAWIQERTKPLAPPCHHQVPPNVCGTRSKCLALPVEKSRPQDMERTWHDIAQQLGHIINNIMMANRINLLLLSSSLLFIIIVIVIIKVIVIIVIIHNNTIIIILIMWWHYVLFARVVIQVSELEVSSAGRPERHATVCATTLAHGSTPRSEKRA